MSYAQDDYRTVLYKAYLSSQGEGESAVIAAHVQVRESQCHRIIREFFPQDRQVRILELGCGYGALLHYAAAAGYGNIRGVDSSPEQIAAARKSGINAVTESDCFDALANEADACLDAVVSLDLIEHLSKRALCNLAGEVARVLKPGGRWIVHCPNGQSPLSGRILYGDFTHELCFTQRSLAQVFRAYGYTRVDCFEDVPVAHGLKSAIRLALWRMLSLFLRVYVIVETGQVERSQIFTQNLFCIAYK